MYETAANYLWLTGLITLTASLLLHRYHDNVRELAGISFFCWCVLAYQAGTLTTTSGQGVESFDTSILQFVALILALFSLLTILAEWFSDPEDSVTDNRIQQLTGGR